MGKRSKKLKQNRKAVEEPALGEEGALVLPRLSEAEIRLLYAEAEKRHKRMAQMIGAFSRVQEKLYRGRRPSSSE